jgi:hypothetical protein
MHFSVVFSPLFPPFPPVPPFPLFPFRLFPLFPPPLLFLMTLTAHTYVATVDYDGTLHS